MNAERGLNWPGYYEEIQKQNRIPTIRSAEYGANRVKIQDLFVDIYEIYDKAHAELRHPRSISVYADVAAIKRNIVLRDTVMRIFARRVEFEPGADIALDLREYTQSRLIIYTLEVQSSGKPQVKLYPPADYGEKLVSYDIAYELGEPPAIGLEFAYRHGEPNVKTRQRISSDSLLDTDGLLRESLDNISQYAAASFESDRKIVGSMLQWIQAVTNGSMAGRDLNLQSAAMLAQFNVVNSQIPFIPVLDKDMYKKVARAMLESAQKYDEHYQTFLERKNDGKNVQRAADVMQGYYQDITKQNQLLLDQSISNYEAAQKAAYRAEKTLADQHEQVNQARLDFEMFAEKWLRQKTIEAALQMFTALGEFAVSIGGLAMGNAGAGGATGDAVAKGVKAAQDAANVAKVTKEVSQLAETMKNLSRAMTELKKIGQALQKTFAAVLKIVAATKSLTLAEKASDVSVPLAENLSAQAEWDAFRVEARAMLQRPIAAGIRGATNYQKELEKLAIFGKAFMACQVAAVRAGQEVAQLKLQEQVSSSQEERLDAYLADVQAMVEDDETLMQLFYTRELNVKRWLYLALNNYSMAFRYWALKDSQVQPQLVKRTERLWEDLASIERESSDVESAWGTPPQYFPMERLLITRESAGVFTDVLDQLIEARSATVIIDPQRLDDLGGNKKTLPFEGKYHIRVKAIHVYLEGVDASEGLLLRVKSSGAYADRDQEGKIHHFTSIPTERNFGYIGKPGSYKITDAGELAESYRFDFMKPTPFSDWTIDLRSSHADLANLSGIMLEFVGEALYY